MLAALDHELHAPPVIGHPDRGAFRKRLDPRLIDLVFHARNPDPRLTVVRTHDHPAWPGHCRHADHSFPSRFARRVWTRTTISMTEAAVAIEVCPKAGCFGRRMPGDRRLSTANAHTAPGWTNALASLTQVVVHGDRVASWEEIALWFVLQCEWGRIATAIFQEKETIMIHKNTFREIVAVSPLSPAVVVERAC